MDASTSPADPLDRALRLTVVFSPDPTAVGRTWCVTPGTSVTLGRGRKAPDLIADPLISGRHLEIRWHDGAARLEDLASSNGTYVDGQEARAPTQLRNGSVVSLGDTVAVAETFSTQRARATAHGEDTVVESLRAQGLRRAMHRVAGDADPVLLVGEAGTDLEAAARTLHVMSGRPGQLRVVDCARLAPASAAQALLAPATGALAQDGTVFLEAIDTLPRELQDQLLEGNQGPARVVAGAYEPDHHDFFCWVIHVPALRDRRADVLRLWKQYEREAFGTQRAMTSELVEALLRFDWPGNERQLRVLVNMACSVTAPQAGLDIGALPPPMRAIETEPRPPPPPRAARRPMPRRRPRTAGWAHSRPGNSYAREEVVRSTT